MHAENYEGVCERVRERNSEKERTEERIIASGQEERGGRVKEETIYGGDRGREGERILLNTTIKLNSIGAFAFSMLHIFLVILKRK